MAERPVELKLNNVGKKLEQIQQEINRLAVANKVKLPKYEDYQIRKTSPIYKRGI